MHNVGLNQASWPLDIVKLIIELLVHGVPPSPVPSILASSVKVLFISIPFKQLPSMWFIYHIYTVLLGIVEILAAYYLAKRKFWIQSHTDATTAYQTPFLNLLIGFKIVHNESTEFSTFLLSTCISQLMRHHRHK